MIYVPQTSTYQNIAKLLTVTTYPLAGIHYLNLLNQLIAIRSSRGFSHLRPGDFHMLYTQQKQHIQPREWKKRRTNKHGLGLAPSARRQKFEHFYVVFCASVAIASVYPNEIPTEPPEPLIYILALANADSGSKGPGYPLSSRHCQTVAFPWLLLTALEPCLSSSSSGLVGNLTRKPFVWVSRQSRHRNPLTGAHPHPQKLMDPHRVTWLTDVLRQTGLGYQSCWRKTFDSYS